MGNRNTLHSRKREIYQVPAAVRVIDILDYLNKNQTASFTEIYSNLNLPKTSAFHILSTLELRGIIRKTAYDGKYSLGLKLYELGNTAVARFDIKKEAIPILKELAIKTNQTAHLGILDGMEGVYLEKIESKKNFFAASIFGS